MCLTTNNMKSLSSKLSSSTSLCSRSINCTYALKIFFSLSEETCTEVCIYVWNNLPPDWLHPCKQAASVINITTIWHQTPCRTSCTLDRLVICVQYYEMVFKNDGQIEMAWLEKHLQPLLYNRCHHCPCVSVCLCAFVRACMYIYKCLHVLYITTGLLYALPFCKTFIGPHYVTGGDGVLRLTLTSALLLLVTGISAHTLCVTRKFSLIYYSCTWIESTPVHVFLEVLPCFVVIILNLRGN